MEKQSHWFENRRCVSYERSASFSFSSAMGTCRFCTTHAAREREEVRPGSPTLPGKLQIYTKLMPRFDHFTLTGADYINDYGYSQNLWPKRWGRVIGPTPWTPLPRFLLITTSVLEQYNVDRCAALSLSRPCGGAGHGLWLEVNTPIELLSWQVGAGLAGGCQGLPGR